ncbi:hypothetical protein HanHA89_Chr01g0011501 [Helianthus annuus]|nr:hypothetical protein HanHA89_Chr01g0011501 [Helianthus annuus]
MKELLIFKEKKKCSRDKLLSWMNHYTLKNSCASFAIDKFYLFNFNHKLFNILT